MFHYLLEGFRLLRDRGVDAGLATVGDGGEREGLEKRAVESAYSGDVKFYGLVVNRDLPPFFRGAAVGVHPKVHIRLLWEQWSHVGMQALACGKSLIISDTPQMRGTVTTEAAVFVPKKNPVAIADPLEWIFRSEPLRREMSKEACAYA